MARIEEVALPGVGVRYDFTTEEGLRVGVVHHRTGRREVFICPSTDPDSAFLTMNLTDDEAHTLVDVLGGSQVVESLTHLKQQVEGLSIDWLLVEAGSPYAGKTMGDAKVRTRTGASVVAIIRGTETLPSPAPSDRIEADDTLVVVGTSESIAQLTEILASG